MSSLSFEEWNSEILSKPDIIMACQDCEGLVCGNTTTIDGNETLCCDPDECTCSVHNECFKEEEN